MIQLEAEKIARDVAGWFGRVRFERHPQPTSDEILRYRSLILPAIRHVNDMSPVVTAIQTQPDWVLSTNTAHWNERLAERTGLRIATPLAFLTRLSSTGS